MTPTDTYKKSVEELNTHVQSIEFLHGVPVALPKKDMQYLKDFLKSHTIALLEGEIAVLEWEKKPEVKKDDFYYENEFTQGAYDYHKLRTDGYNQALQDQINRLQAEVDNIKSL